MTTGMKLGMKIGIDFDNTLVDYDDVFPAAARERGLLADLPGGTEAATKSAVRALLRAAGREQQWTRLQGEVYGPLILRAVPYPGALAFVKRARAGGADVVVISHKTRRPIVGEPHDLVAAARGWLVENGFFAAQDLDCAFFEPAIEGKLARVETERCTHFVDDLPELLLEPAFPKDVERILFDPHSHHANRALRRTTSWHSLAAELFDVG